MIDSRFVVAAERELEAVVAWYEGESPGLGMEFLDDLGGTLERARRHPHSGALVTGLEARPFEVRRFLLRRFPYKLIVAVTAEALIVVAVMHEARAPRYWLSRLPRSR